MFIKEMQHLATGMQPAFLSKNFAKILTLRTFVGLLKLGSREKNPTGGGREGQGLYHWECSQQRLDIHIKEK